MKKIVLLLLLTIPFLTVAQQTCTVINKSFRAGEVFNYKVSYNWGAIWVSAGEATFSTHLAEINGQPIYHFVGEGNTYPKYDFFYKVRDRYESYADTATLQPYRFKRDVQEGNHYTVDDYVFNHQKKMVYTATRKNKKKSTLYDSIKITTCTNDVMTAIFYARCLDFEKYKPNDTIPITFVLDGKVYPYYIRYIGKEVINNELLGKVDCIKFRPKLIDGTLFKDGEEMIVWVTDDNNKMPVYVETPILVGTIKVSLYKYKGLRNKMECIAPTN